MQPSSEAVTGIATGSPLQIVAWTWVVAIAFVMIHSVARFNSPPTNRADTTLARYWSAAVLYACGNVCLWLLLVETPDLLDFGVEDVRRFVPPGLQGNSLPFLAALLVTSLLPHVPFLAEIDARVRIFFLEIAQIPDEALRLTRILRSSPLSYPDPRLVGEIKQLMAIEGFNPEKHVIFGGDGPYPQRLWTKVRTILYWFSLWETDRRFSAFRRTFVKEFATLEQRYEELRPVAVEVFRLLEANVKEPKMSGAIALFKRGFLTDAGRLEQDMCRLISRAMLKSTVRESARSAVLATMGFSSTVQGYPLFDKLLGLSSVLGAGYAFLLVIVRPDNRSILTSIVLGIGIAAIYWTAIFWALWSRRYAFAMRSDQGRSSSGYVLTTAIAIVCAFAIGWVLQSILVTSMIGGLRAQRMVWPWILMAGTTALVTAFLVDTRPEELSSFNLRFVGPNVRAHWVEAGVLALATALAVLVVHYLLLQECLRVFTEAQCADPQAGHVPPLIRLMITAALTGAAIGWCVPRWYRASMDAARRDLSAASAGATPEFPIESAMRGGA